MTTLLTFMCRDQKLRQILHTRKMFLLGLELAYITIMVFNQSLTLNCDMAYSRNESRALCSCML